jgi:aspartyl/asparaginyl-tRNA synthetase
MGTASWCFGFGVSRTVMVILGQTNIREITFIPRDPKRLFMN